MKYLILLILFTCSIKANDPTVPKGKLKEALEKRHKSSSQKKKTIQTNNVGNTTAAELQEDINQLVFKAFYTKDSVKRLMLIDDKQNFILETNKVFVFKGETYRVLNMDNKKVLLLHSSSKNTLTYTYRP